MAAYARSADREPKELPGEVPISEDWCLGDIGPAPLPVIWEVPFGGLHARNGMMTMTRTPDLSQAIFYARCPSPLESRSSSSLNSAAMSGGVSPAPYARRGSVVSLMR